PVDPRLAVRRDDDRRTRAFGGGEADQTAGAEDLVIRMRRQHEEPRPDRPEGVPGRPDYFTVTARPEADHERRNEQSPPARRRGHPPSSASARPMPNATPAAAPPMASVCVAARRGEAPV